MAWTVKLTATAVKQLKKIDRQQAKRIRDFLRTRITQNPRQTGKALQGSDSHLWRYRVGYYRIICELQDQELVVLLLRVGHRSKVYR